MQDISNLEKPDLEMRLRIHNAEVFTDYQKAVDDYSKNVCCSCQQLHQKKNVTVVRFDDNLGTAVWPLLKDYLLRLFTWTKTVIVHVYNVHIVCGYGMLTSSNESETMTNFFYIRVYIYSHN